MLLTTTMIRGLVLAALAMPAAEAMAAGPPGGRGFVGPGHMRAASGGHRHPVVRVGAERHVAPRLPIHRHGGFHGRRFIGAGAFGPWLYPADFGPGPALARERREPVDRDSFEHMPVRIGMPAAPTPEPTIYRIEGPRDRPVARVIRIGAVEPRNGVRSRYAHAETGALLLTVPARARK